MKVTFAPLSGIDVSLAVFVTEIFGKKSTVTRAVSEEVTVTDSQFADAVAVLVKLANTLLKVQE